MTANINPASPGSATAFWVAQEIQAGKTASPDKQFVQLRQDHATISSAGDLVRAALEQPEVRADRFSPIKEAIGSGTYKIEPNAIASSMLADQ